jgi:UDP-N-acetyl-D-mannosaminuronic acid dehydrogenase
VHNFLKSKNKGKESKIFVTGLAFKGRPETDDMRGSLSVALIDCLKAKGYSNIFGHDFVVKEKKINDHGIRYLKIEDGFSDADCVIACTNHINYSKTDIGVLSSAMKKDSLIYDIWHNFDISKISRNASLKSL